MCGTVEPDVPARHDVEALGVALPDVVGLLASAQQHLHPQTDAEHRSTLPGGD
jgi:hypothetical protein